MPFINKRLTYFSVSDYKCGMMFLKDNIQLSKMHMFILTEQGMTKFNLFGSLLKYIS